MTRRLLLAAIALSGLGCLPEAPEASAPWSVRDGFIRDDLGRTLILRGVNLSGGHKQAPYFDFHGPADFEAVRQQLGMNALRFLIEWAAVEPSPGAYDDAYLDAVRERLDWARDANLHVVLDMHQDLFGEGFAGGNGAPRWACEEERYAAYVPPDDWFMGYLDENVTACFDKLWTDDALQQSYADAWAHVAERLADHPSLIGFDVINEPWQGSTPMDSFEPSALQPFYERVVPAVRAAAPHWLAFLEPSSMSNLGRDTQLGPFPFENVVYAPHSYDPSFERSEGFDDDNRAAVLAKLDKLAAEAARLGAALWVGEYGGDADLPGIAPYMDAESDAMAAVLAGGAYWDHSRSDGFGLYDVEGNEKTPVWDGIVRPAPELIAGEIEAWSFDEVTGTFTLSFTADSEEASVLRLPTRAYPDGYELSCAGCEAEGHEEELNLLATEGAAVQLTVRPAAP